MAFLCTASLRLTGRCCASPVWVPLALRQPGGLRLSAPHRLQQSIPWGGWMSSPRRRSPTSSGDAPRSTSTMTASSRPPAPTSKVRPCQRTRTVGCLCAANSPNELDATDVHLDGRQARSGLDASAVACLCSAVYCAAMLRHGHGWPSRSWMCRAAGAFAEHCSKYNEQEVSNTLLSFGKLEFVDMGTLEVQPPPPPSLLAAGTPLSPVSQLMLRICCSACCYPRQLTLDRKCCRGELRCCKI